MENLLAQGFETLIADNLDPAKMLFGLFSALLLGLALAQTYKWTHKTEEDRHIIMQSLVLLSITIAASMMIVGNNLARAFGLVGAVSIIRFRTSVQNPKDMAFVFIAIVVGMASGLGFYFLGLFFAIFSIAAILLLTLIRFGRNGLRHREYCLIVDWWVDFDCRQDIEETLKRSALDWYFDAMVVKPRRKILTYIVILHDESDPLRIVREVREAIPFEDPKLGVSLKLREKAGKRYA